MDPATGQRRIEWERVDDVGTDEWDIRRIILDICIGSIHRMIIHDKGIKVRVKQQCVGG